MAGRCKYRPVLPSDKLAIDGVIGLVACFLALIAIPLIEQSAPSILHLGFCCFKLMAICFEAMQPAANFSCMQCASLDVHYACGQFTQVKRRSSTSSRRVSSVSIE